MEGGTGRVRLLLWLRQVWRAYPSDIWLLGIGCFVNVGGLSLLWPVNAVYIHSSLGKPMTVAGLVLMLYSAMGFIGSLLAGWLYDKAGMLSVMVAGLTVAGLSICVAGFRHDWITYILVMAVFGLTCAMPFPAINAMAGQAWPAGGRRAYNFLYVANNLGVAAGTAIGGVLAQVSFQSVFFGIGLAYAAFLILVLTLFRRHFGHLHRRRQKGLTMAGSEESQGDVGRLGHGRDEDRTATVTDATRLPGHMLPQVPWVQVLVLLVGFVSAWSVYVQWQSTVSVYMQSLGYSLASYSMLWTLNGLLIFVGQPLVSAVVRRLRALTAQMVTGCGLYGVCFMILAVDRHYASFVVAMVVLTLGEMLVWPAVPAALARLAPAHRAGLLQGMSGSAATLGRMVGPVLGGVLYDHMAPSHVLLLFTLGLFLPVVCFYVFGRLDQADYAVDGRSFLSS
jgi:MFS family permease